MPIVEARLYEVALERNLRRFTVLAYKRSLKRLGLPAALAVFQTVFWVENKPRQ